MRTRHVVLFKPASRVPEIAGGSVSLVLTSPPYPMIEMWDGTFAGQDARVATALHEQDGRKAFELMNGVLDAAWDEMDRVLVPGGIACINIGDATRSVDDHFQLYPSHARVIRHFHERGYHSLPGILWRKQTNAPNKFMGSGMLPPGAYVTLEHEHVLVFRKGGKRVFDTPSEKRTRRESAFFWEERNAWFSDSWEFKGIAQAMARGASRTRSAAFPFELAYRLVNMFSVQGDLVVDPFLGTGTTMLAAMASCRHSTGVEIDKNMASAIAGNVKTIVARANECISSRLDAHRAFIDARIRDGKPVKYLNEFLNVPVVTAQERDLQLHFLDSLETTGDCTYEVRYKPSIL